MTGPITFNELWSLDYEPKLAEKRRRALEHRTDAMVDGVLLTLCGEPVRQITAHDVFTLDGLDNPFVAGSEDGSVEFVDCAAVVWELHAANSHTAGLFNLRRRAKCVQRLACIPIESLVEQIESYLNRMMLLEPKPKDAEETAPSAFKPEAKTHFLVPMMVEVASQMGHVDPLSGLLISQIPLPRLIQYRRAMEDGKPGDKTYTEIDSLRVECQTRVNEINWLARQNGR